MRVLIVDDHPWTREAIARLLRRVPGFEVVGEAGDGDEAVYAVRRLQPDLVLMDLVMPRCDGFLATRLIRRQFPQVRVVVLTVHHRPEEFWEAIRSGAQGYLVKGLHPDRLVAALQELTRDDAPVTPGVARTLLRAIDGPSPGGTEDASARSAEGVLTPREREVAVLVARGLTNREIAGRLYLSEHTVKNHVKRLLAKLGARNRAELVRKILEAP